MRETYYLVTGLISAAIAYVSGKLGILMPVLGILILLMVLDYITGMLASKQEAVMHPNDPNYGWSSKKGFNGIVKKVAILAIIIVAITLDYALAVIAPQLGFSPMHVPVIGLLTTSWFLLNEMLSIIENAGRMGADVPHWLSRYIAALKNKIDDEAEPMSDPEAAIKHDKTE